MPTTQTKRPRDLVPGDVVLAHGMRCLVIEPPVRSRIHPDERGGCYSTRALVLNRDEVPDRQVPRSFTSQEDGRHLWNIQGNDLALYAVELSIDAEQAREVRDMLRCIVRYSRSIIENSVDDAAIERAQEIRGSVCILRETLGLGGE